MSNYMRAHSEGGRGMSPRIWGDYEKHVHDMYMGKCITFFDDFGFTTNHASAQASGGWFTYQDTGVTITGLNTASALDNELGVLVVTNDGTDNDEGHVQFGHGNMFQIDNANTNTGAIFFECRLKKSSIADNALAFFVGLGQGNVGADYLIDDTGALHASRGFLGFQVLHDDGDGLDTTYKESGQTQVVVKANAATLVANTYIKLGFVWRPTAVDPAKKIVFYINGAAQPDAISTTNIDAAAFPEGTPMQPMFLTKIGEAVAHTASVDWVAATQYMDGLQL